MSDYIYDCEIYRNVFTVYIGDSDTRKCYAFEISDRRDNRESFIEFLRNISRTKGRMVGYNNLSFDYPLVHFLLKNQNCSVGQLYDCAQNIIDSQEVGFTRVPPDEVLIPQLDLFLVHHFNNKARSTSLKVLEFNMLADNIEDLPYTPGSTLTPEQIDILLPYNKHDMYQTFLFYKESLDQIRFREELTKKYKRNFLNHNDTKIGKDYFIMRLEEQGVSCFNRRRQPIQTIRETINLQDCILPYISFQRPEFNAVKEWLSQQTISETKGVFTDIIEADLGELAQYASMRKKSKKLKEPLENPESVIKGSFVEERKLKSKKISIYHCWNVADNLNCVSEGLEYVFGTGGLHASLTDTIIEEDDDYCIVDADVTSMYPSIAIANNVYPEHLGEKFCTIYKDVFEQRKSYKKGTPENAMMKLALNGVYGDSNNVYSPFYDPQYTMTITISGQLSLLMLAETLMDIENLQILQCNTDGVTVKMPRQKREEYNQKCIEWEKVTGLSLEYADYSKMCLRDCNNYIAVGTDGKIKRKGVYAYKRPKEEGAELGWHQNHSMLIVPKAAEAALIDGKDIEEFILSHDYIYDFMLRTKVPRTSRLVGVDENGDTLLQNTTRYYVSNNGYELVKIMPPLPGKEEERRIGVQAGKKVTVCNNIKDYNGDIDYDFYIFEAKKLVEPLSHK